MRGGHHPQTGFGCHPQSGISVQRNPYPPWRVVWRDTVQLDMIKCQPDGVRSAAIHAYDTTLDRTIIPPVQHRSCHGMGPPTGKYKTQRDHRQKDKKRRRHLVDAPGNQNSTCAGQSDTGNQ